jgi:C1A family cysteine protease
MAQKVSLPVRSNQHYGWVSDLPDIRDFLYKPKRGAKSALPAKADITKAKGYFGCYDQLQLGSCTANAIAAALQFDALIQGKPLNENPSRLFIYYGERVIEGTVGQDAGAQIRDGIKVVAKLGAPPESVWPYSDDAKTFKTKPSPGAYTAGLTDTALTYKRLSRDKNLIQFRASLAVDARPFVFGFSVYESFESQDVATSGIVPMPTPGEQLLGGHAVLAVGYDDKKKLVKVRNSWGPDWGQSGHFWLPYAFFTTSGLTSDFWAVDSTSVQ